MPAPGDKILLSVTLLSAYGMSPITHSCKVEVRDADGIVVLAKTDMILVVGTVYRLKWVTNPSLPEGPYHIIYYAILDGEDAPEIGEVLYIEKVGISPSIEALLEQIHWMTYFNRDEAFAYDSQGRTEKIVVRYAPGTDFTSPVAVFEWSFTYNADNSIASFNIVRVVP